MIFKKLAKIIIFFKFYSFQTNSKRKEDNVIISPEYEMMTKLSCNIKSIFFPIIEYCVASIPAINKGIRIGSESIGNNAPLTFAFATIAPIIVEHPAIPIPEINIVKTRK